MHDGRIWAWRCTLARGRTRPFAPARLCMLFSPFVSSCLSWTCSRGRCAHAPSCMYVCVVLSLAQLSFSRFAPPPSSPLAQSFSASQLEIHDSHEEGNVPPSPVQADARPSPQARKRLPDTQTPLTNTRPGQKPKLSRSFASEFLPSTLGRSYSNRFPADHRLRPDFVREYALDGELGKGGYGFVMAATHRRDGHEVAVKFITKLKIPPVSWSVDDCGRPVPKEARLLSQLDHPGIVKFLDLFG